MKSSETRTPYVLSTNNQPDVLKALRFFMKGEDYRAAVSVELARRRDRRSGIARFRCGSHGPQLHPRYHQRAGRPRTPQPHPNSGYPPPGDRHDRVGQRRTRRRSHAPRRTDTIQKPWDDARLSAILGTGLELGRALRRGQRLEAENRALRAERFPQLIAQSAAMRPVLDVISRVGPSDATMSSSRPVKTAPERDWWRRLFHFVSLRSTRPLVQVNTGGLAEGVFDDFGTSKAPLPDQERPRRRARNGGEAYLFLDEIANISQGLQSKLLRTLKPVSSSAWDRPKTRRVDVRVFSATNADIAEEAWPRASSARICSSASIPSNSACPHCATATKRSRTLPAHFLRQHAEHYQDQADRLRRGGHRGVARARLAGRSRTGSCRGARRADGAGRRRPRRRFGIARRRGPRLEEMSLEDVEALLIKKALARFSGNVSHANTLGLTAAPSTGGCRRYRRQGPVMNVSDKPAFFRVTSASFCWRCLPVCPVPRSPWSCCGVPASPIPRCSGRSPS